MQTFCPHSYTYIKSYMYRGHERRIEHSMETTVTNESGLKGECAQGMVGYQSVQHTGHVT